MVIASVENVKEKLEGDVMPNAVLKDKEVGKLWAYGHPLRETDEWVEQAMQLIRKLVGESRAALCQRACDDKNHLLEILERYGIDPKTWEE